MDSTEISLNMCLDFVTSASRNVPCHNLDQVHDPKRIFFISYKFT